MERPAGQRRGVGAIVVIGVVIRISSLDFFVDAKSSVFVCVIAKATNNRIAFNIRTAADINRISVRIICGNIGNANAVVVIAFGIWGGGDAAPSAFDAGGRTKGVGSGNVGRIRALEPLSVPTPLIRSSDAATSLGAEMRLPFRIVVFVAASCAAAAVAAGIASAVAPAADAVLVVIAAAKAALLFRRRSRQNATSSPPPSPSGINTILARTLLPLNTVAVLLGAAHQHLLIG